MTTKFRRQGAEIKSDYKHGTGDHLQHIVCIVCLDRFSRKKNDWIV